MKKALLSLVTSFLITSSLFSQVPAYVPTDGLVGYWPFNGNANDESGNGNNGTVNGATLTTDRNGNANSAFSFDGVSNFIQLPLSISNQPISVSCWFKTNAIGFQSIVDNDIAPLYGNDIILSYPYYGLNSHDKICLLYHDSTFKSGFSYSPDLNYHAIAIWDDGLCQLYINGISAGSKSHEQGIIEGGLFRIGVHSSNSGWFNGIIDDVAIYNRALTQEEITSLYNGTTTIPGCTNTTACNYNASATQDDGSCTFPAQTYLNCAGTCVNDVDADGTCDELESPTLPSYLPSNGLVGYWPFNGNANDESGNGNNGTVNGATLTTDRNGNANKAYSFNNSYIVNDSPSFAFAENTNFTCSAWAKFNSFTVQGEIVWSGTLASNNFVWLLDSQGDNLRFGTAKQQNSTWYEATAPTTAIQLNQWAHFTAVYNNGTQFLYINDILVATAQYSNSNSTSQSLPICFGAVYDNSNNVFAFFDGEIDDIAIYNRALTQEEITALYNGTTDNNSGNNNNTDTTTVPAGISYQAVARNAQGTALANTAIQVKFTLITDSLSGTSEYAETHSLSTNSMGLFATAFGIGTAVTGTWAGINWTHSNKYLKVELDAGNGFVDLGTQQLLSSPFAIRAQSAATIENGALPVFADNAAAITGGLTVGKLYRTATGELKVVY